MYTTERGRFARISVEINLNKKLITRLKIRNRTYLVEYEGINQICFSCGKYGHHKEVCITSSLAQPVDSLEGDQTTNNSNNSVPTKENLGNKIEDKTETFGSWMMAKRTTRNKWDNKRPPKGEKEKRNTPTDNPMSGVPC